MMRIFGLVAIVVLVLVELGQLPGRAEWRIDGMRLVELTVVDLVHLVLLVVEHDRLKPITPQDLRIDVARTRLRRLTGGFDRSLEDHHDFEAILQQIRRRHIIERRFRIDFVRYDLGPDEEQIRSALIGPYFQLVLILSHHFALAR
uniref:Putative secreted protein n=1 Tax=Anopheles marajoara TaxID=58244 RepID=A0A2M4C6F7_9DIPT